MIRGTLSDDELTKLAMAEDLDTPVPDDAVSLAELTGAGGGGLLPQWYMAAPAGGRILTGWRRNTIYAVITAFVTISAAGLCNTYGQLEHLF